MKRVFSFFVLCVAFAALATYANANDNSVSQTIESFDLSGFNPNGSKDWDVKGKTAYIEDTTMRFDGIEAHGYTEGDVIKVTSDKGEYDQRTGNLLLKDNVVAKSTTGAKIITDKALWETETNTIKADGPVLAIKGSSVAKSKGAEVKINDNKIDMKENVAVEIERDENGEKVKTSITCEGPLNVNYKDKIAVFNDNVVVHDKDTVIYSDKLFVYFNNDENKITSIVAKGSVRIVKGDNETRGQEARYDVSTQELTMMGRPTVLFYGEDDNASFGD